MSLMDWFDMDLDFNDSSPSWKESAISDFWDNNSGGYSLADSYQGYNVDDLWRNTPDIPSTTTGNDGNWWNNAISSVGDFLGSEKGLGLLAGAGKMGLNYLQSKQAQDEAMEQLRLKHEYEMELLRLKSALSSSGSSSGGGTNQYSHNEGIAALAKKYPVQENFKRNQY